MEELEKSMYYGAQYETIGKAKALRKNMTEAEKKLWNKLKGKQLMGLRFRRQHPIDIFIADFYCHAAKLVIELDGEIHSRQRDYDEGRSAELERFKIEVIRFKNEEVLKNIEKVVLQIEKTIKERV